VKHECMVMNPKQGSSHNSGNPLPHCNWKKHAKYSAKPKWCWLFS